MSRRPSHKVFSFLSGKYILGVSLATIFSVFLAGGFVFAAVTLSQNIQLGSGTPDLTLNGDDLYVTGTFEVDGTALFDSNVGLGDSTPDSILDIEANSSGASVSDIILTINNASSTAADPYLNFQIDSTSAWRLGADDSDSNKFRLTPGASFSATSSGITINAAGFVGIGTTNPISNLHVFQSSPDNNQVMFRVGINANSAVLTVQADGDMAGVRVLQFTDIGSGDLLNVASPHIYAIGSSLILGGRSNNVAPSVIVFVTDTGTSMGERVRIDSFGNVGIGTNSPSHLLTVSGTDSASTTLAINNQNGGDSIIALQTATTTRWYLGVDDSDSNKFRITPGGAFSATSSGITIDSGGNVGIGTTNPISTFDVSGSLRVQSASTTLVSNATTTLRIESTSASQGACLVMKDSAGVTKYVRIEGTSFVINTTSCE